MFSNCLPRLSMETASSLATRSVSVPIGVDGSRSGHLQEGLAITRGTGAPRKHCQLRKLSGAGPPTYPVDAKLLFSGGVAVRHAPPALLQ